MRFSPGMQIYKYTLKERLGSGNYGEVWLADEGSVSQDVAVKLMGTERTPAVEQLKEARIGNRLKHDNLVKIHYADVVGEGRDQVVIIVMDYYPEGSVSTLTNAANYLPLTSALDIISGVLRGLEHLHELGYYHGDIKPSNILIGANGESLLCDYGITLAAPEGGEVDMRESYLPHAAPEVFERGKVSR